MSSFLHKKGNFLTSILEIVKTGCCVSHKMSLFLCQKKGEIREIVRKTLQNNHALPLRKIRETTAGFLHPPIHICSDFFYYNSKHFVIFGYICKNFQVEFEWLRQFWMQGVQRAKERDRYWKQPMEELEQAWKQMELMVISSYRLLIRE